MADGVQLNARQIRNVLIMPETVRPVADDERERRRKKPQRLSPDGQAVSAVGKTERTQPSLSHCIAPW
jgi:hypothetical protein